MKTNLAFLTALLLSSCTAAPAYNPPDRPCEFHQKNPNSDVTAAGLAHLCYDDRMMEACDMLKLYLEALDGHR